MNVWLRSAKQVCCALLLGIFGCDAQNASTSNSSSSVRPQRADRVLDELAKAKTAEQGSSLKEIHESRLVHALPAIVAMGLFKRMIEAASIPSLIPEDTETIAPPIEPNSPDSYEILLRACWHFGLIWSAEIKQRSDAVSSDLNLRMALEWSRHPSPVVRYLSIAWLFRQKVPQAVALVVEAIENAPVRECPWLVHLCESVNTSIRTSEVEEGLRRDDRWFLAVAAIRPRKEYVKLLVERIESGQSRSPEDCVWTLGEMRYSDALPTLLRQLEHGNVFSRADAAEALAKIGDKGALPVLLNALEGAPLLAKAQILLAIGSLGSKEDIPILKTFAEKPRRAGDILDLSDYAKRAIAQIEKRP